MLMLSAGLLMFSPETDAAQRSECYQISPLSDLIVTALQYSGPSGNAVTVVPGGVERFSQPSESMPVRQRQLTAVPVFFEISRDVQRDLQGSVSVPLPRWPTHH